MNYYNQNEKINQVKESTLVIGTDIAKNTHVARAQDFRGIELSKPFKFNNTRNGFNGLLMWIRTLMLEHEKKDVILGFEPTGQYWMTLAQFLRENGVKVVLVNPLHVKRSKELDDNSPTKNDVKDARVIGQLVKDGRYSEPNIPTGVYAELRTGMNMRDRLVEDLIRIKGRIDNWIDRFFPEFFEVFKNWDGKAALLTLKLFPLPEEIVEKGAEEVVRCWKQKIKRAVGMKRATRLVEAAKRSIGLREGQIMARQELRFLLDQYYLITSNLEEIMQQIEELLKQIPGSEEMMSVPGVGLVTVAGFLSEVGDLNNYKHPRQIQKLAGLNLKENSSGKHKGRTTIAKRGRPRLRALLFNCVRPLVAKNEEFKALHQYYTERSDNPLTKMQSLIALCCKLIRILFALGRNMIPYSGQKLRKDSTNLLIQNAA